MCIVLFIAACSRVQPGNAVAGPNYDLLGPCERPEQAAFTSIYAESLCGHVSVFEDRNARQGRKIDLNVMIIPAIDSAVKPDSIFFLAGGPGQAATDIGPALFTRLRGLRMERDIVLVDQRGTGRSNPLTCEADENLLDSIGTTLDEAEGLQLEHLRTCLATYDANPALYTTPIAMDDLNEVREVLGYGSINLYGISYGTRAALVYLRRHGSTVRSVILDGVVPLTMSIPGNVALDAQAAFDAMLADCKLQPGCAAAFPGLDAEFHGLIRRLQEAPETVVLTHPRTGKEITFIVEPRLVTRLVRTVLYERTLTSLLPLAIHAAWTRNYQPLVTLAYAFAGEDLKMSTGMMASVLCSEDFRNVNSANDAPDFDNPVYAAVKPVCEFWPTGEVPADYFEPVQSDVPVLLASGKLDPITPPVYGIEAAATLTNSQHVIVPGTGHVTSLQGCMPRVMREFLDDPEPRLLNASCVSDLKRPPFFTSFAGTAFVTERAGD